jgi:magnesium transporter
MVASIFGMNLRSTLEMSVIGFWGTTALIVAGSAWVYWVLFKYTKRKRIL